MHFSQGLNLNFQFQRKQEFAERKEEYLPSDLIKSRKTQKDTRQESKVTKPAKVNILHIWTGLQGAHIFYIKGHQYLNICST